MEDEIRHLKNELHSARNTIVDLMPKDISDRLHNYYACQSRADAYQWQNEVVDAIIDRATPLPERLSDFGVVRALCPLCGEGSQGPYDEGFAIPEGLRRHLAGRGNVHQCGVTEAAFALAREYWDTTIEEVERQKRVANSEEKARRRKTDLLFKCSPAEKPELIEERCWGGEQPRTQEELLWAEERLSQLGFTIALEERVKSYVKEFDECTIYADPRTQKKITFYVYPKNVSKRRRQRSQSGNFFIMDSWKHDLATKFEERRRNAVPQ